MVKSIIKGLNVDSDGKIHTQVPIKGIWDQKEDTFQVEGINTELSNVGTAHLLSFDTAVDGLSSEPSYIIDFMSPVKKAPRTDAVFTSALFVDSYSNIFQLHLNTKPKIHITTGMPVNPEAYNFKVIKRGSSIIRRMGKKVRAETQPFLLMDYDSLVKAVESDNLTYVQKTFLRQAEIIFTATTEVHYFAKRAHQYLQKDYAKYKRIVKKTTDSILHKHLNTFYTEIVTLKQSQEKNRYFTPIIPTTIEVRDDSDIPDCDEIDTTRFK